MYLAAAAAMRSASLARQVGAAILSANGEVVSIGANEVPKPHGGMYWEGESSDDRDVARGQDESDLYRHSLVADALERLKRAKWLDDTRSTYSRERLAREALVRAPPDGPPESAGPLRSASVMDILEFIRAMHAEQAAIADAACRGVSVRGCILYVTTFPCHECARLILGSGIGRVVYIEPYAKSRAVQLYPRGIALDENEDGSRIPFVPFSGIAPAAFKQLFQWPETRKSDDGKLLPWQPAKARPRGASKYPGHIVAEQFDIEEFSDRLKPVLAAVTESSSSRRKTKNRKKRTPVVRRR